MKKFSILFLLTITLIGKAIASHEIGHTMSLINIKDGNGNGTDNYKFRIVAYEKTPGAFQTQQYTITIRKNANNSMVTTVLVGSISSSPNNLPIEYCTYDENFNGTYYGIYESDPKDLSALNDPAGYYATAQIGCCLTGGLDNYLYNGPGIATIELPAMGSTSPARYNSTPQFILPTRTIHKTNLGVMQNWSATDIDGDLLVYSVAQNISSSTEKPYEYTTFSSGNSMSSIFPCSIPFQIDASTGYAYFKADKSGTYLTTIKVTEYRNGVKLSESIKDFTIFVYTDTLYDQKPQINYMGNLSANAINTDLTINTPAQFDFEINDFGAIYDSVGVYFLANTFSNIDTGDYNWQLIDSQTGTIISTFKSYFSFSKKSKIKLRLAINPSLNNQTGISYHCALIAMDNSCYFPQKDTFPITFYLKQNNQITVQPKNTSGIKNSSVYFKVKTDNTNGVSYQWQTAFGFGFVDINNNNQYKGANTDSLSVNNLFINNHQQLFRCKVTTSSGVLFSQDASIDYIDTCRIIQNVNIYTKVSDTLKFEINKTNPANVSTTIKVFSGAGNSLNFDLGNISNFSGYRFEIRNSNLSLVYANSFNQQYHQTNISNWNGVGNYKMLVYDPNSNFVIEKNIQIE